MVLLIVLGDTVVEHKGIIISPTYSVSFFFNKWVQIYRNGLLVVVVACEVSFRLWCVSYFFGFCGDIGAYSIVPVV